MVLKEHLEGVYREPLVHKVQPGEMAHKEQMGRKD